jgi:hypothetical protein
MSARACAWIAGLVAALTCGAAWSASGAPVDDLVEVGSGELRWLGIELYEARLLSREGRFESFETSGPVALEIVYRRSISRARLLQATHREWRRLGRELGLQGDAQVQRWLALLADIWPDVGSGDRIVAMVEPGGGTRFYGNDGLLGLIDDPDFGPAFLAIWLHPATRANELRSALLGVRR